MDRNPRLRVLVLLMLIFYDQHLCLQRCRADSKPAQNSSRAEIDAEFNRRLFVDEHPEAESMARFRLRFVLNRELQRLGAFCQLSQEQTQKLTQAGTGDIARACDRVQAARRRYHELAVLPNDVDEVFDTEFENLSELLATPHGRLLCAGSLFEKSCNRILSDQQKSQFAASELKTQHPVPRGRIRPFIDVRYLVLKADPREAPDAKLHVQDIVGESTRPHIANSESSRIVKIPRPPTLSAQEITIGDDEELTHVVGEQRIVKILGKSELRSLDGETQLACVAEEAIADASRDQMIAGCEIAPEMLPGRKIRLKISLGVSQKSKSANDVRESEPGIRLERCTFVTDSHHLVVVRGHRLPRTAADKKLLRKGDVTDLVSGKFDDEGSPELIVILYPRIIERGVR